eukprot:195025_1
MKKSLTTLPNNGSYYDFNCDETLIINNRPDVSWIKDHERQYKINKSSIKYDMRIYVDVPYDAGDEFRDHIRRLNQLRPLNQFDRSVSVKRKEEIPELQEECVFLWLKYYINTCIERRTSIPNFLKSEQLFQNYFDTICNQYVHCKVHDDDEMFSQFKQRIRKIALKCFYDKETCINIVNGYIGHSQKLFIPSVVNDMCLLYYSYVNIMYVFCDDNGDVKNNTKGCMTLFHSNNLNDLIKMLVKNVIKDKYVSWTDMSNIRLW